MLGSLVSTRDGRLDGKYRGGCDPGPERLWLAAKQMSADVRAFRPEVVAKECDRLLGGMFSNGFKQRRGAIERNRGAASHGQRFAAHVYRVPPTLLPETRVSQPLSRPRLSTLPALKNPD